MSNKPNNRRNFRQNPKGQDNKNPKGDSNRRISNSADIGDRNDSRNKQTKYNDPSWYNKNAVLTHNVANLSFNNALGGVNAASFENVNGDLVLSDRKFTMPGIMAIQTGPSIGYSITEYSAINLAAKNFYSWIRHANSGHSNYDSPDLMMYLLAMDQIYSMIAYMMRIYGTARVFSQVNRYVGDALLSAMRVSPTSIRQNLSDFRAYLNMFITKASAFVTPATMDLFKRHFWMYSGIFRDSNVAKSQMYLYVPAYMWYYNEINGSLSPLPVCTKVDGTTGISDADLMTWTQVAAIADTMLNAIVASEDMNIMSGDILKAYPTDYWKLDLVPEDYAVLPVYSKEVLDQIHNTEFVGMYPTRVVDLTTASVTYSYGSFSVLQDKTPGYGVIQFTPQVLQGVHLTYDSIIDFEDEVITEDHVMVASRNMIHGSSSDLTNISGKHVTLLDAIGTDIPFYATVYIISTSGALNGIPFFTDAYTISSVTNAPPYLTQFNRYPFRWYSWSGSGNARYPQRIYGEIDNYSVIGYNDLKELHDVALLSMFAVPYLGTKQEK